MTTPSLTRQEFLAHLELSGVLNSTEFEQAVAQLPASGRGKDLARALVKNGWLTHYQASSILAGKPRSLVIGQYTILRQRGKGGLGKVYKAVHKTMHRLVALKVLSPRLIKTDKARDMFRREVVAVARLVHPNIVTAYDANTSGERFYLVMEYVAGPDLERLVRHSGPVRPAVACEIIRQAAVGLQYASEMGMLHRDIKPANILLQKAPSGNGDAWVVKLVDFGLARLQVVSDRPVAGIGTILTRENTVMGTPDYLSPEQSRDLHKVDIRSDLYSLGCTFYFILTGRPPFPGGTPLDKMIRHASEEPTPLQQIRPEIPAEVAQIVRRLLAKQPEDRFQSPAELAQALAPFAAGSVAAGLNLHTGGEKKRKSALRRRKTALKKALAAGAGGSPVRTPPAETLPSSISPTPLPVPEPPARKQKANPAEDGASPTGLLVALGMVLLIILVAVIVYFFPRS